MAIKTFSIDWEGKKASVSYDDDIPFGDSERIVKNCLDLTDLTRPKVDMGEYRMQVILAVLTKAPFKIHDPAAIRKLPKKTAKIIMQEVMQDYPLASSLEDWMTSFTGSVAQIKLSSDSTPTVQPDTVGTKKQSTASQPGTSKS